MESVTGSVAECLHGQFQCRHSGACISTRLVCDGHYQCGGDDTSDELGCVNSEYSFLQSLLALILRAHSLYAYLGWCQN